MTSKKKIAAGKSLVNARENMGKSFRQGSSGASARHSDVVETVVANGASVIDESSLTEFLAKAELAGTEFAAEKMNSFIIEKPSVWTAARTEADFAKRRQLNRENILKIPRRPAWTTDMSADDLYKLENESFLSWRRDLAEIEKMEGLVLTPFEKNLELWRQLWRVVEKSDVVVQILDARNPELYLSSDLQRFVLETNAKKKNFVLLNKADFLSKEQREIWASYFRSRGIPIAFWSAVQTDEAASEPNAEHPDEKSSEHETGTIETDSLHSDDSDTDWETESDCSDSNQSASEKLNFWRPDLLTTPELLELFRAVGSGTPKNDEGLLTVGMVGYPNVGKSSTINKIIGHKKVSVSATPGKTKHFQTLFVEDDLMLCDCPGLVMPSFVLTKAEMIVWGILPIDQMRDCVEPINLVCQLVPREALEDIYGVRLPRPSEGNPANAPISAQEFLTVYAFSRGYMSAKGIPDKPRAARYVLKDFVKGKVLHCVCPPGADQDKFSALTIKTPRGDSRPPADEDNVILNILQKRHLLECGVKSQNLDNTFFNQLNSGAMHTKSAKNLKVDKLHDSVSSVNGKSWKKHNNMNKNVKLRQKFAHLDA